jgi:D-alanine-D-alanine ligase
MITVGVLYGGKSGEHEVSLCSAASVVSALDKDRYSVVAIGIARDGKWFVQDSPVIIEDRDFGKILKLEEKGDWRLNHYGKGSKLVLADSDSGRSVSVDIVFPVVHGTYCEDGTLQGLLELAMVPYVGADVTGSAIGMDKDVSKRLMRDARIPVVPWETVTRKKWNDDRESIRLSLLEKLGLPLFVKPCSAGSSVGVKKIKDAAGFDGAVDFALRYDNKVLVEKAIFAREIEGSVLGNDKPEASTLGEVIPHHEFYSYEAKYISTATAAELVIPADIQDDLKGRMRRTAVEAFSALNCSGMARIDFFVDKVTWRLLHQ